METSSKVFYFLLVAFSATVEKAHSLELENGNVTLILNITETDGIFIDFLYAGSSRLSGHIGYGIQFEESGASDVQFAVTDVTDGFTIYWESPDTSQIFQDCFKLNGESTSWFTGRQGNPTEWPIEKSKLAESPYILKSSESIAEPYWLNSNGVFLFVNETTPLFVDQNVFEEDSLCFFAKIDGDNYANRGRVVLNYTIGAGETSREAHFTAINDYLGAPTGTPDLKMIREPIWSTSVKFQKDFNSQFLYDFAQSIRANDFRGQVQIEDGWEDCYGSLSFDRKRFADIANTFMDIQSLAFRVTLWIHPFINDDCTDLVATARQKNFFVKDANGGDATSWWNGQDSHLIDFTNEEARKWFLERIAILFNSYWLDGVKFDAGEASFLPTGPVLQGGDVERQPNEFSDVYNSLANVTTMSKARSGWRTQWVPVFVSIPDKESNWGLENGLKSVVVNLMQLNIAGYTIVSPGLVGGSSGERPSPELFVRWLQAVTFMPLLEFGYLPWEFYSPTFDVLAITKKFVDLHSWYSDKINNVIKKCKSTGLPVNAPVWWIDSANPDSFKIIDQYMLGEDFLIAPILDEGVVSRDVYLPPGTWEDGNNQTKYEGGTVLKDYYAPIDVLPYFVKDKE